MSGHKFDDAASGGSGMLRRIVTQSPDVYNPCEADASSYAPPYPGVGDTHVVVWQ